jgi:hypothetical protein
MAETERDEWRFGAGHLRAHSLDTIADAIATALSSLTGEELEVVVTRVAMSEGLPDKATFELTVRKRYKDAFPT